MKFLEKVKNMFTEEVEEEVKPIKTEIRKVEIPAPVTPPVQEENKVEEKKDLKEEPKKEEKFKFPVYFDDKDFDNLPKPSAIEKVEEPKKEESKSTTKPPEREEKRKEAYGGKNPAFSASIKKEEKKTFKPTPIISPVYGILDKNYRKDDITPKKIVIENSTSKKLTVDDIRNKAFGTLEDDLETTLFGKNSILFNQEPLEKNEDTLDLFDELDAKVEEPKHSKEIPSRAEKNKELELMNEVEDLENIVVQEREIEVPDEIEMKEIKPVDGLLEDIIEKPTEEDLDRNMIDDEMDKICSEPSEEEPLELTESDLFNLIDSMYEKKDGEE